VAVDPDERTEMPESLNVLLGVSGGIAAFKTPEIVRSLRLKGHAVRCAMTRSAGAFVTPLTLEVLTELPVYREEYLEANNSGEELHITAARWADVMCVAPATCNTLARLALGLADDFLATTSLAFTGRLLVAPAMTTEMWEKPVIQAHVATLRDRGVELVGPVIGPLATGEVGMGRMAEPEEIVAAVEMTRKRGDLAGTSVLVTAGPTHEPLDPVRFLSNRSSGKMGFSLAAEAASRGARTLLVSGPVALPTPRGVERFDVATAAEMAEVVERLAPQAGVVIMAAAVADFKPREVFETKLKKGSGPPILKLESTQDILSALGEIAPNALRIGFAAETGDLEGEARRKLEEKRAHWIIANDVSRSDIGFGAEVNEVTVYRRDQPPTKIPQQAKRQIASELFDLVKQDLEELVVRKATEGG
jgi:phosphopantothenoylcysteine decarboxylase/phosphopantothenate--cysteine ligase